MALPFEDTTRPLVVPQEYLFLNVDYLTHANIHNKLHELSPHFQHILTGPLNKMNYRIILHKYKIYTYPEVMNISAKLSNFLFQKQYKYGPLSKKSEQTLSRKKPKRNKKHLN